MRNDLYELKPGNDFELDHVRGLDFPQKVAAGTIKVISTKMVGRVSVLSGLDEDERLCWLVTRIDADTARWAVAHDIRQAERYTDQFQTP